MKIIVTGSDGYIAKNLIKNIKSNNELILLSRKKKTKSNNKIKIFNFDLKKKIIPRLDCDVLIHAAAITPQKKYSDKEFNSVNFLSLKNILKNITKKNKIIFFSTTDVYKNQKNIKPVKENLKINLKKISNYAKSKHDSEKFLKSLNKKKYPFQKIILRLPGIVGNNNHQNFITQLIENTINKKDSINFCKTNFFNNIYHIVDLIKIIKMFISKKISKNFLIINIGTKNPIKISKILQILKCKTKMRSSKVSKKDSFTINVTKLNKYYKRNQDTKAVIKKYFKEKLYIKK